MENLTANAIQIQQVSTAPPKSGAQSKLNNSASINSINNGIGPFTGGIMLNNNQTTQNQAKSQLGVGISSSCKQSVQNSQTNLQRINSRSNISSSQIDNNKKNLTNEQIKIGKVNGYQFKSLNSQQIGTQSQTSSIQGRINNTAVNDVATSFQRKGSQSNEPLVEVQQNMHKGLALGGQNVLQIPDQQFANNLHIQSNLNHQKLRVNCINQNFNTAVGNMTSNNNEDQGIQLPKIKAQSENANITVTHDNTTRGTHNIANNSLQSQTLNGTMPGLSHSSQGARTSAATDTQVAQRGLLNLNGNDMLIDQMNMNVSGLQGKPPAIPLMNHNSQRVQVTSLPQKQAMSQKNTLYDKTAVIDSNSVERQKIRSGGGISGPLNEPDERMGSRQFDSFLQRRQIIQQQREKKQELLKQLDQGMRSNDTDQQSPKEQLNGLRVDGIAHQQSIQPPVAGRRVKNQKTYSNVSQQIKDDQMIEGQPSINPNAQMQLTAPNPANGVYYSSISPTRGQKYLLSQHQRGPNPINYSTQSNQESMPLTIKQQNSQPDNQQRFKANVLPLKMPGTQESNIFVAPGSQNTTNNEFTQYLQSQLGSPPPAIKQGVTEQNIIHTERKDQQSPPKRMENVVKQQKMFDYMFIQMSMEAFNKDFAGKKILVMNQEKDQQSPRQVKKTPDKKVMLSPQSNEPLNLNGLVKIKAYESQLTDEIPAVQCNLQPTQLDHLKVLVCEQEDKYHPKLTLDASNRFEIEKQNQIKQYMEDIITKLQQKDRRFKVTCKKKFIEDALYNSTHARIASVYVVVINRDKTFDPLLNGKFFKCRKRLSNNKIVIESSSEEEDAMLEQMDPQQKEEYLKMKRGQDNQRRSANSKLKDQKRSLYDSDANGYAHEGMNTTSASSNITNFKKLMQEKSMSQGIANLGNKRGKKIGPIAPNIKRPVKKDDEFNTAYKYTPPVKDFSKYGNTKIRITQNINAHSHHQKHPINIFFNQYNEFIRLVLKNQKLQNPSQGNANGTVYKFNHSYALGLAKQLGMNLKRDAFCENNMKQREYINQLKEKLVYSLWRKLNETNKDLTPPSVQQESVSEKAVDDKETLDVDTMDSSSNHNNTPKSKSFSTKLLGDKSTDQIITSRQNQEKEPVVYPPSGIIYKYFIGKGNNSIMVRSLFKNRFWWVQHDKEEMDRCNFCWTQIRRINIMEAIPCKYPNKKSGIKNIAQNNSSSLNTSGSLLATPQQKSAKKRRMASVNLQTSDKANALDMPRLEQELAQKIIESKLYNKVEDNFHLNNKKALFLNMKNYYEAIEEDVFDNLPVTFHVKTGLNDAEFERFKNYYFKTEEAIKNKKAMQKQKKKEAQEKKNQDDDQDGFKSPQASTSPDKKNKDLVEKSEPNYYQSQLPPRNIWIIKPGENTNQGKGIQVAKDFDEIRSIVQDSTTGGRRTCIVQKYIHNPLLINRRKFDIRTFVLMTCVNGNHKTYVYEEGYLRTSCREYSINNLSNKLVHLTNDAVQKRAEDYGKFEPGNKLSYNEFQMFLDKNYGDLNINFERDIKPQMNKMTADIFRACYNKLDPKRRTNLIEVFGLDFMVDDEFRPYLIEVNTNPCLELSSPLLARLIPNMLENALKIGLDSQFLPPEHFSSKKAFIGDACPENRFELVYDSIIDGPVLDNIFKTKENIISKYNFFQQFLVEMDEDELSEEEEHDDEE